MLVISMRDWRNWINMPVDPTCTQILMESHPNQLAEKPTVCEAS